MRTSFSYLNYPNLWDEILNHTSTEAQRNVRLVSRALRAAVDRRIRHVILTPGPPESGKRKPNLADVPKGVSVSGYDAASGASVPTFPDIRLLTPEAIYYERTSTTDDNSTPEPTYD